MPIHPENRALYDAGWPWLSQMLRFACAGGRCMWCRARHGELHPLTGSKVVLTVAHLDHDPTNDAPANHAALCQRCHNRHDVAHRRQGIAMRRAGVSDTLRSAGVAS